MTRVLCYLFRSLPLCEGCIGKGCRLKELRQATVEPVLGTLINFMKLRKINTRGIQQAHKGMLLAAAAYNLQKLLRFTPKTSQIAIMALPRPLAAAFIRLFWL